MHKEKQPNRDLSLWEKPTPLRISWLHMFAAWATRLLISNPPYSMRSLWLHTLARFSADFSTKYGRGPTNVCCVSPESKIYKTGRCFVLD